MSAALAGIVAHAVFWGLLLYGLAAGELSWRGVLIWIGMWLAGLLALTFAPYQPARQMFSSLVAILDIVLVFVIVKGDVRIT